MDYGYLDRSKEDMSQVKIDYLQISGLGLS